MRACCDQRGRNVAFAREVALVTVPNRNDAKLFAVFGTLGWLVPPIPKFRWVHIHQLVVPCTY
jgi:hypothetical protein